VIVNRFGSTSAVALCDAEHLAGRAAHASELLIGQSNLLKTAG
jgi:hypothetical protein